MTNYLTTKNRLLVAMLAFILPFSFANAEVKGDEKNSSQGWYIGIEGGIPMGTIEQDNRLITETLRLLPTAHGFLTTRLFIQLIAPNGTVSNYDIEAPIMKFGGKYQINLEYGEMKPYMYLTSTKIDDWTEEWIYRGEILNPED